jgi:Holliday junction resolvasome RuvABC endonuclease subunit
MTLRVLAFDTATKTGVAVGCAGEAPRAFSVALGTVDWPMRFCRLLRITRRLIEEHRPDLVAVEAFVGGPKANSNLVGLVACVQGEATRRGVRVVSYYPATVRKHFLGGIRSRAPIKTQVMARCRLLGWPSADDDACDALALWDYACAVESRAHQMTAVGGLFAGPAS